MLLVNKPLNSEFYISCNTKSILRLQSSAEAFLVYHRSAVLLPREYSMEDEVCDARGRERHPQHSQQKARTYLSLTTLWGKLPRRKPDLKIYYQTVKFAIYIGSSRTTLRKSAPEILDQSSCAMINK